MNQPQSPGKPKNGLNAPILGGKESPKPHRHKTNESEINMEGQLQNILSQGINNNNTESALVHSSNAFNLMDKFGIHFKDANMMQPNPSKANIY